MLASPVTTQYTHLELGKEIEAGSGRYYTPQQEVRLKYQGREVLCVIGQAVVEASCCGSGNWRYAIVPGYIVNWQKTRNDAGRPVSEVELISDEATRENIRKTLETKEGVVLIGFW